MTFVCPEPHWILASVPRPLWGDRSAIRSPTLPGPWRGLALAECMLTISFMFLPTYPRYM